MASSPGRHNKRRKASCKEFQCTHEGCGRTYSRAEHLQRHQLNHSPKEIYYCDYPGCSFSFVRKDLYARHKLRHERQVQQYGNGRLTQRSSTSQGELPKLPRTRSGRYSFSEDGSAWSDTQDEARETPSKENQTSASHVEDRDESVDTTLPQNIPGNLEGLEISANAQENDPDDGFGEFGHRKQLRSRQSSISPGKQPMAAMQFPMSAMQGIDVSMAQDRTQNHAFVMQNRLPTNNDQLLEEQPFGLSPSSTDEFTTWLFNGQGTGSGYSFVPGGAFAGGGYSNNFGQLCPDYSTQPGMMGGSFVEPMNLWFQSEPMSIPTDTEDIAQLGKTGLSEHKRQSLLQYMMQRFNEIGSQGTKSAADIKNEIFGSDTDADTHVLSLANVQRYITSYWENFHDQLPILHRPTFTPEKAHDFLLLAVLIMGASMLAKKGGPSDATEKLSKFTNFVSWNLRWQVFMHADSHPPAKLWVIQTLLILEVYEKTNATRVLHERANIYFPTTLSLMRRGSALTGKQSSYNSRVPSPLHSPRMSHATMGSTEQRRAIDASPDKWWDHWIAQEATRRAAFAAFILDATHAALFGHTPTLVIHEIKLPLPCDNTLWSSDSPSEIGCVESSLHANGVTPMSFLEGLRKTLNGQRVHTSPFGRIALLAALLSVTWQMHQRDLDRSTLGTDTMSGVQERWRPKLLRAFDWWKKDYEDGVAHVRHAAFDWQKLGLSRRGGSDDGDAFQTLGTVLYHLGHITVHISMPELCIFAGVTQILGRSVSPLDWRRTEAKIKEWVASPGAIGGVYHALQLIKLILLGRDDTHLGQIRGMQSEPTGGSASFTTSSGYPEYTACNDNLLTRAWALYYAALVLWAYGFVQDGILDPFPHNLQYPPNDFSPSQQGLVPPPTSNLTNATPGAAQLGIDGAALPGSFDFATVDHDRHQDLKTYMQIMIPPQIDSAKAFHLHQHQVGVVGSRNKVIGLLSVVDRALYGTTWELLSEARHRLRMAAATLRPRESME
ncbi:Fc.00g057190.m01.CDS01 [Cosmosporella sp. VM-42]